MGTYRSTINLPECARDQEAEFPDTPRTAVLVGQGVLVPVTRSIMTTDDIPPAMTPPATAEHWDEYDLDPDGAASTLTPTKITGPPGAGLGLGLVTDKTGD